jgi:hypothetical protein
LTKLSFAQDDTLKTESNSSDKPTELTTPFNRENAKNSIGLKGKILPWIAIGSGVNSLIGIEFGFHKQHSIGFDIYFHRWSFPAPEKYDSTTKQYIAGQPRARNRDKAVFLNYRFYFKSKDLRDKKGIVPYIGAFSRAGYFKYVYDEGYITNETLHRELQYSFGVLGGILATKDAFYDINLGIYYKQKYMKRNYYDDNVPKTEFDTFGNFGFRLGLNLYLWK